MKVIFMGTPDAAVPTLRRLTEDGHEIAAVFTQPDRPSGRGNKVAFSPVKSFALEKGLNVFQPEKVRNAETIDQIERIGADAIVVVAYGKILPEAILNAARLGAINVHFSLLPKYRGAAPVNWAIVNGEERTGVTTMKMDVGLDTGDILLTESLPIFEKETAPELTARLSMIGADLLSRTLANFDSIVPEKQEDALATLAPILSKGDGNVDWDTPALSIERRLRGFQPFPGCYTFLNGLRIVLRKADVQAEPLSVDGEAGTIQAERDVLYVKCADGTTLEIHELQPEGKRPMSAREFLNGNPLKNGGRFRRER